MSDFGDKQAPSENGSSSSISIKSEISEENSKNKVPSINSLINTDLPKITTPTRPRMLQSFRSETAASTSSHKNVASPTAAEKKAIHTQTDWSWIQDMQMMEKIRREGVDFFEEITKETLDDSGDEAHVTLDRDGANTSRRASARSQTFIDSVGPPKILQYKPETKKPADAVSIASSGSSFSIDPETMKDLAGFMNNFNVYVSGGHECEFCGAETKPWPTIKDQENISNINELYCCNDYQEFVEGLIEYQIEKEKLNEKIRSSDGKEKKKKSSGAGGANAHRLAQERAEYRKMQLLLERKKRMERLAHRKLQEQQELAAKKNQLNGPHALAAATAAAGAKSTITPSVDESTRDYRDQISNQVRSINYQLSNLKYIQQGWTFQPPNVIDFAEMNLDEVEFNLTSPEAGGLFDILEKKKQSKPLLIRKYKNGNTCLVLFPDESGTVFYPSGRTAISMSTIGSGMHIVNVFSDDEINPILLATFDPFGNACVNYSNGNIRLLLSPLGGLELDPEGSRKKRWLWWDFHEHVHAPPLQPLVMSLNSHVSLRVLDQEKINLGFSGGGYNFKFGVGSKLRIANPEAIVNVQKSDPNEIYLRLKRKRINELLRMMNDEPANHIKLPKISNTLSNSTTPRSRIFQQQIPIFKLTQEK